MQRNKAKDSQKTRVHPSHPATTTSPRVTGYPYPTVAELAAAKERHSSALHPQMLVQQQAQMPAQYPAGSQPPQPTWTAFPAYPQSGPSAFPTAPSHTNDPRLAQTSVTPQRYYSGHLPTPAESFPGGMKYQSYQAAGSSGQTRLPPGPEDSPTVSRYPQSSSSLYPANTQSMPPPSPRSPSISSSSSAAHPSSSSNPTPLQSGERIPQPDFGKVHTFKAEVDENMHAPKDVFGVGGAISQPAPALAEPLEISSVKADVDMDQIISPEVDITQEPVQMLGIPPTPIRSGPVGLGIFSPGQKAEDEEKAKERKRKRLEAFQRPRCAESKRRLLIAEHVGVGRIVVPVPEDHPTDDSVVEPDELLDKLKSMAGWQEGGAPSQTAAEQDLIKDPKERAVEEERRKLLERFLDSEGEMSDSEGEVAATPRWGAISGRGKGVPMDKLHVERLVEPNSGDAMDALKAAAARAEKMRRYNRKAGYSTNAPRSQPPSGSASPQSPGDDESVDCICGTHTDDGAPMVQCNACNSWSHIECLGLDPDDLPEQWYCKDCAKARKGKGKGRAVAKLPSRTSKAKAVASAKNSKALRPAPPGARNARVVGITPIIPQTPATPIRPALQREPTFAPADDSGVHGRAALRMKGAEILVPRTPTPSQGESTPWIGQSSRFDTSQGLYTPTSTRRPHYAYPNTVVQMSPTKRSQPFTGAYPSSAGWHTNNTPRIFEEFDREDRARERQRQLQEGPGAYDMNSTPSRGLKFGTPWTNAEGLITPVGLGGGRRRDLDGPRQPSLGLLTPFVGEETPRSSASEAGPSTIAGQSRTVGLGFWSGSPVAASGSGEPQTPARPSLVSQEVSVKMAGSGSGLLAPLAIVERSDKGNGREDNSDDDGDGDVRRILEGM